MIIKKNTSAYITFTIIILYSLYVVFFLAGNPPVLPDSLAELLFSIIRNKIIILIIILLLLYIEGDGFKETGFTGKGILSQAGVGILFGIGSWILINMMVNPLLNKINPVTSHQGVNMDIYMKDILSVSLWIPVLLIAVFVEEFQRIFVLTRFEKWFGKYGLYIALLLTSVTFGIGHLYQGVNPAIGTGLGGLIYALVYLRKRLAWEAIISHAVFNILSVIGGYMINNK